jgi:S-adenosylmethionine:tRNA ribosyltransferase-isomerase
MTANPNGLTVADFDFHLPEELIAQQPPAERGSSRMLVVERDPNSFVNPDSFVKGHDFSRADTRVSTDGALAPEGSASPVAGSFPFVVGSFPFSDRQFADLPSLLNPGDLLILNDSRVIPARLYARRANSRGKQEATGQIEVLLTSPDAAGNWSALVRPGRKVRPGDTLEFFPVHPAPQRSATGHESSRSDTLELVPGNPERRGFVTGHDFSRADNAHQSLGASAPANPVLTAEVLASGAFGERTLRFEPVADFYAALEQIGHMPLPPYIKRDDAGADRERYQTVFAQAKGSVAAPTAGLHFTPEILTAIQGRGVEIAKVTLHVGLGTFAPLRVKNLSEIHLHRERYTLPAGTAAALNRAMADGRRIVAVGTTAVRTLEHCAQAANGSPLQAHSGETSIFLQPGHRFQLVSAMLTNFHLPQSSLLMLVSAFAGRERILAAYEHAVRERYRFFSYGDCMFLV